MKKLSAQKIAIIAMLTAFTTAATVLIKIPTVATEGYINVGDGIIMFSATLFGPFAGFLIGGLGSCLSDLISGYAHWILPTFLIKGAEGAAVSAVFLLLKKIKTNRYIAAGIASTVGGGLMVAGYFFAAWIMKGSAAVAAISAPMNCLQWLFGVVLAEILLFAIDKTGVLKKLGIANYFCKIGESSSKDKPVDGGV